MFGMDGAACLLMELRIVCIWSCVVSCLLCATATCEDVAASSVVAKLLGSEQFRLSQAADVLNCLGNDKPGSKVSRCSSCRPRMRSDEHGWATGV